jgi:signal transduction histidine kinase
MFPTSHPAPNDPLFRLLPQLAQVTTPAEWVEAVSFYARERGASAVYLTWIDCDAAGQPTTLEMAADWVADVAIPQMPLGRRAPIPDDWEQTGGWFSITDSPTYIDDVRTSALVTDLSRCNYAAIQTQALVFLPQHIGGRWVSALAFHWQQPQQFTEADHQFYMAVLHHAGPVVNALRLMQQSLSAQQETASAKAESDMLYKLAEAVSAAMTYQGVMDAIANVRYYHQAQELAALEERTRLARELHDSVSQALYGIGLGAQTMRKWFGKDERLVKESLDYILTLAEAGLTEMRALIFELRPESLENEGLITALAKQGASLQARHGIDVRLELCDEPLLPLNIKEGLYRVAREAMHNVVKHAAAAKVTLRMATTAADLRLEVIDDGLGFDTGAAFPGHLGLHSMKERISGMGGELSVRSAPGAGTSVTVRLPVALQSPTRE